MKEIELPGKAKITHNFQLMLSRAHYNALLLLYQVPLRKDNIAFNQS